VVALAYVESQTVGGLLIDRVAAGLKMAKERPEPERSMEDATVWSELARFDPDPVTMARHRIVTFGGTDPACASYDMMRTRLLFLMERNGWTSVGITSPTNGCGKTTTSLNLAFSLAKSGRRIVLVDLDLRRPAVARQIGLTLPHSMADVLQATGRVADNFVRCGDRLAIGSSAASVRNSGDVLLGSAMAQGIADFRSQLAPDLIIYDLPPMLVSDDALAFVPHLDVVLVIAATEVSRPDEIAVCQEDLEGHGVFVGVVVNKCRYEEADYEYTVGGTTR
jgi:Mrp family chromosome partitioning ATPase